MTERTRYKLPKYYLGQTIQVPTWDGKEFIFKDVVVTEDMINPDCKCENGMHATFCMEGHMTECHAGMSCAVANCSHMDRYE